MSFGSINKFTRIEIKSFSDSILFTIHSHTYIPIYIAIVMDYRYFFVDLDSKVYCCRQKHICFSTSGSTEMAKTNCPVHIRYQEGQKVAKNGRQR